MSTDPTPSRLEPPEKPLPHWHRWAEIAFGAFSGTYLILVVLEEMPAVRRYVRAGVVFFMAVGLALIVVGRVGRWLKTRKREPE